MNLISAELKENKIHMEFKEGGNRLSVDASPDFENPLEIGWRVVLESIKAQKEFLKMEHGHHWKKFIPRLYWYQLMSDQETEVLQKAIDEYRTQAES